MKRFCKSMTNRMARLWHGGNMKTKLAILTFLTVAVAAASAQNSNLTALLQQGLLEEQGNRNFDAAIADYQSLAAQFDKDRQLAATAIFRLGECYRAEGKTNEAAAQYQRITREFADQTTLVILSQQDLRGMEMLPAPPASAAAQQQRELLAKRIALAQRDLADAQRSFQLGLETHDKVGAAEGEVLRLQQQLAALDSSAVASSENMDAKLWESLSRLSGSELEKVLPTLVPDPVLENLLQERNQAESRLAELSVQDANTHPDVKKEKARLETIDQQINKKIEGMMQALKLRAEISRPGTAALAASAPATNEVAPNEDQEIQWITQMMENSPDLIKAANGGVAPLASAAGKGELHVASFLLDHGAEINPSTGDTPLHRAAMTAQKTMVELLLNRGADINARPDGTALGTAAQYGYQAVVEVLLARKADVNLPNGNGDGPLFLAAARGHAKIVQMLLGAKANANAEDHNGDTPLMAAARSGSAETVSELLAGGADANKADNQGIAPLSYAVDGGSTEMVKLLLAAKADPNGGRMNTPLILAIHRRDTAAAELLLAAGANPKAPGAADQHWPPPAGDQSHLLPLWLAIEEDDLPMVKLLLKFKADPNDSQRNGVPLIFVSLGKPQILQALLDAGAKTDLRIDNAARTPLQAAVMRDETAAVEILLKHGLDPNERDSTGETALHLAAQSLDPKVYKLLLDYHADPNAQDHSGNTPLFSYAGAIGGRHITDQLGIGDLLRRHGALDNPPRWNVIEVNRLSGKGDRTVFQKGTNDWNHFTLLETILHYYVGAVQNGPRLRFIPHYSFPNDAMAFPDLTKVTIVRPSHNSTNETRITVNLLDGTNGIDCQKDVPLEFADMVEIPEREHSLGDPVVKLTDSQVDTIADFLKGHAQLVVRDQKAELPLSPFGDDEALIRVLQQPEAQKMILSSSDLSRVKVVRHDPKTGEIHEWVLDYNHPPPWNLEFLLRDGDVIEIPEKS